MLEDAMQRQVQAVFGAARRLAECRGVFEGIREEVILLPKGTSGEAAHALNRIQLSLLECMVMLACGMLQQPKWPEDASLRGLSNMLADSDLKGVVTRSRDTWYSNMDYREDLIKVAKEEAHAKIVCFQRKLAAHRIDDDIKRVRDKVIAHITTGELSEPLIRDVTRLADEALDLAQLAHDIFDGGDSGLGRLEIFKRSARALVRSGTNDAG